LEPKAERQSEAGEQSPVESREPVRRQPKHTQQNTKKKVTIYHPSR
jgi:hypothetical protein